jgi:formylglycine-generating enzyme required for sulfatase activity
MFLLLRKSKVGFWLSLLCIPIIGLYSFYDRYAVAVAVIIFIGILYGITFGILQIRGYWKMFSSGMNGKKNGWITAVWLALTLIFSIIVLSKPSYGEYNAAQQAEEVKPEPATGTPANALDIEMVQVQGGTFTMGCTSEQGSDCGDGAKPAHSVTLSSFSIGKYEVTQAQWKAVMGNNPSKFEGDNLPVEQVSWDDIQEFLRKLNALTGKRYRLPTEAEWEYAARGGNASGGNKYSGSNNIDDVAWYDGNSDSKTHAVGSKRSNELGIYDMSGNVREWCSDWYDKTYYSNSPQTNPTGAASGSIRVVRVGYWNDDATNCAVATRTGNVPSYRNTDIGFRVVVLP